MGYCYANGRLVCDRCSRADGTTRRHRCPAGYCQALALCPDCRAAMTVDGSWTDYHKDCAAASARFHAQENRKAALLATGAFVRCSALAHPTGAPIRVLFECRTGQTVGYDMAPEVYGAIPLLEPATPADYETHGALTPAPGDFNDL